MAGEYNQNKAVEKATISIKFSEKTKELVGKAGTEIGKAAGLISESSNQFAKDLSGIGTGISSVIGSFMQGWQAGLMNIANMFISKLGELLTSAFNELDTILDYSRISQSGTRNLMLGYGFNSSEAYGYTQAMSALGFQSEEDLMYASPQEMELFRNAFTKYTEKYSELYDKGFFQDMLEYEVERKEFEQDIKLEVTQFLIDNKDLIKAGMEAILTLTKGFLQVMSWLTNSSSKLNRSAAVASASSVINQYKGSTITMSNTFNNVTEANKTWINESVGSSVTLLKQLQN